MITNRQKRRSHTLKGLLATSAGALSLATGFPTSADPAWEDSYDARLGVTIAHPAGWSMHTSGYVVVVQSPDRGSMVLAEAFAGAASDSASSKVAALPTSHAALFPHATLDRTAAVPGSSGAAMSSLSFVGSGGRAETARVLCSLVKGSGMLYAIAGPTNSFESERATLVKILQSLRFGVSNGTNTVSVKATAPKPAVNLKYVAWTEPNEHAFTLEVPDGWTVNGGLMRVGTLDLRQSVVASSSDGIGVMLGDTSIPATISIPDQLFRQYNLKEGQVFKFDATHMAIYMHYMPGLEYNRWFLERRIKLLLPDLVLTKETDMPEMARRQTNAANATSPISHSEISVGMTEFSGTSQKTGKPVAGALLSVVSLYSQPGKAPHGWSPQPMIMMWNTNENAAANRAIAMAAYEHMYRTMTMDLNWAQKTMQAMGAASQAFTDNSAIAFDQRMKAAKEFTEGIKKRTGELMDEFNQHEAAKDDFTRKVVNYVSDKTDVFDPVTGTAYKVGSGYTNYYHDARTGLIVGTDSPDRPPVDFTPMQQF